MDITVAEVTDSRSSPEKVRRPNKIECPLPTNALCQVWLKDYQVLTQS